MNGNFNSSPSPVCAEDCLECTHYASNPCCISHCRVSILPQGYSGGAGALAPGCLGY